MKRFDDASQKVSILCWADRVDRLSLNRLQRLARWDRFAGPIAVMPDIHFADEVCVGTVLATENCVLPTAIGQDLGCGMSTMRFDLEASEFSFADFERLVHAIQQRVPCGRRTHRQPQELTESLRSSPLSSKALEHERDYIGARHCGTLGEGNHFIELQRSVDGRLYATVHSGSRGIGAAIARHHAKVSLSTLRAGDPLPWLEIETAEARHFLDDLTWALKFAAENRARMLNAVQHVLQEYTARTIQSEVLFDVSHNLISFESETKNGGRTLAIHRKGAMPAHVGALGIVPGSMGTASYLIEGLGELTSYRSCSHGAGRKLSRGEARRTISAAHLRRQMNGIAFPAGNAAERALVEEAPGAYKDIREVLEQQRDLVKPVLRLEPVAVIKG